MGRRVPHLPRVGIDSADHMLLKLRSSEQIALDRGRRPIAVTEGNHLSIAVVAGGRGPPRRVHRRDPAAEDVVVVHRSIACETRNRVQDVEGAVLQPCHNLATRLRVYGRAPNDAAAAIGGCSRADPSSVRVLSYETVERPCCNVARDVARCQRLAQDGCRPGTPDRALDQPAQVVIAENGLFRVLVVVVWQCLGCDSAKPCFPWFGLC